MKCPFRMLVKPRRVGKQPEKDYVVPFDITPIIGRLCWAEYQYKALVQVSYAGTTYIRLWSHIWWRSYP